MRRLRVVVNQIRGLSSPQGGACRSVSASLSPARGAFGFDAPKASPSGVPKRLISTSSVIHSDGSVQKARSETEVASDLSEKQFHLIADATFDQLLEYMTEVEECDDLDDPDINYSQGVMSIKLGSPHGTWVINKQTPNRQIWWSSPISGPLRFELSSDTDFEAAVNEQDHETLVVRWKSTKDGTDLLHRLRDELQSAIAVDILSN